MTHYSVLGITTPPYVPPFIIKERYKELADKYSAADKHPDFSKPFTVAAYKWIQIEHAYSILIDDKNRRIYDQTLENMVEIDKLLKQKKYQAAKSLFNSFEEVMPSLFLVSPHLTHSILANDDLYILGYIATNLAVRAEKIANKKLPSETCNQFFLEAEHYFRIALELRKSSREAENRPAKFEMNAVSNLSNFLHARALEAEKAGNTDYANKLVTEYEGLLNNFIPLFPEAISLLKDNTEELLHSGHEFFEASIHLAIAFQSRDQVAIAKRYFFQSLEICTLLYNNFEDLESRLTIVEYEIIIVRKFSELNLTQDTQILVDSYLKRKEELSYHAKSNFLYPLQRILSVYVFEGQWDLARNYCTQALMLAKEVNSSSYSAACLIHLDCATILEKDLDFDNKSKPPQSTYLDRESPLSQLTLYKIAPLLHHYRTAINLAISSRDLDCVILACGKTALFYRTLSKQLVSLHNNYRALAEFFDALTHFLQTDSDNKIFQKLLFQKLQQSYEKNRSTAFLRHVCLEICKLYKNKCMQRKNKDSDDPHFVHYDQFNNFIDTLKTQYTLSLPFWEHSPKREKRQERRQRQHQREPNKQVCHSIISRQSSCDLSLDILRAKEPDNNSLAKR